MANDLYNLSGAGGTCHLTVTSVAASSSRWLTEEVFKLIDIVKRDEAIYNPRHKYYFCRPYVENFWRDVDLKLEKNPGASLAKWTNLRISFRREYTNYIVEKVSPCWSYFHRMFFLHPYLRKKSQQKPLDSQIEDPIAQINSLSSHLQCERVTATTNASVAMVAGSNRALMNNNRQVISNSMVDNYLDYLEEDVPNQLELDDIMDDEQQPDHSSYQSIYTRSINNDIKSECEETVDGYEDHKLANNSLAAMPDEDPFDNDDQEIAKSSLDTLSNSKDKFRATTQHREVTPAQDHPSYHGNLRSALNKQRSVTIAPNLASQRLVNSNTPNQCNVSFVRPTFTKSVDIVSTTSGRQTGGSLCESNTSATTPTSSSMHIRHQHRAEVASNSSVERTIHSDFCECKTDPDAMFLMSLLPDIQKLNGRDRGKIKIAFQNILQDYLYPD